MREGRTLHPALVFLAALVVVSPLLSASPAAAGDAVGSASSSPSDFTVVGTQLFFTADDGIHGRELWVTDGTTFGTHLVRDIVSGPASSEPHELTAVGDTLFFVATGTYRGTEPWRSDGTLEGTSLVRDIVRGSGSSSPDELAETNGALFFRADHPKNGHEPWRSNGTRTGTTLLSDLVPGSTGSYANGFAAYQGATYFAATRRDRWGDPRWALWRTDGTPEGTTRVVRLPGGYPSGSMDEPIVVGGRLFFLSNHDDQIGRSLFTTDGTAQGTMDLGRDSAGGLTDLQGILYFVFATNDVYLMRLDPATLQSTIVGEPNFLRGLPSPLGKLLIFRMGDGQGGFTGVELGRSDGTSAGTTLVKDINVPRGSNPYSLTAIGDVMFFGADGGHVQGYELWRTDGTADGTSLVKHINPTGSSSPSGLIAFGDLVVFAANDGERGAEPWVTDGTEAGTVLLADIA